MSCRQLDNMNSFLHTPCASRGRLELARRGRSPPQLGGRGRIPAGVLMTGALPRRGDVVLSTRPGTTDDLSLHGLPSTPPPLARAEPVVIVPTAAPAPPASLPADVDENRSVTAHELWHFSAIRTKLTQTWSVLSRLGGWHLL